MLASTVYQLYAFFVCSAGSLWDSIQENELDGGPTPRFKGRTLFATSCCSLIDTHLHTYNREYIYNTHPAVNDTVYHLALFSKEPSLSCGGGCNQTTKRLQTTTTLAEVEISPKLIPLQNMFLLKCAILNP